MRYIDIGGQVTPKHCIYGPRPAEGLVFNNYEWWNITDHLVKDQREREMAAMLRAKEEAKRDMSYQMTCTWSNTLASIKTQGNQKRLEKMEKEKQDRIDQYKEILKTRAEENKLIMDDIRKVMFEQTDPVKTLNSAVGLSLVLAGREKQLEFKNWRKDEEAKKEAEVVKKLKKDIEDYEREKYQEKLNEKMRKNIQKQYLDEQMVEVRKVLQAQAAEAEAEKQDAKNMVIEGQKIHHCNMVEKEYRKKFAEKYTRKSEKQIEHERNLVLEEEEEDAITKIYKEYSRKFKKERKEREERIKNEEVEKRVKISEMLAEKMKESALKEELSFLSAAREKEEQALREEENRKERERQGVADLLEQRKVALERRAEEAHEAKEREKWELIQNYRKYELNKEWERAILENKNRQAKIWTAELDAQCKELQERREEELKEQQTPLEDETAEKEALLRYFDDTMKFAKEHNLQEYPILAAISEIKKEYRIEDKEKKDIEEKRRQMLALQRQGMKSKSLGYGCYCLKY